MIGDQTARTVDLAGHRSSTSLDELDLGSPTARPRSTTTGSSFAVWPWSVQHVRSASDSDTDRGRCRAFIRTSVRVKRVSGDTCDLLCLDVPRAEALRRARPSPRVLEGAAARARALGDPTRLAVAVALRDGGELCVCDLAWVCERSDKLISHHSRALRAAGLVSSRREGKMVLYALTTEGLALLDVILASAAEAAR